MSLSSRGEGLCSSINATTINLPEADDVARAEDTVRPCCLLALPVELINLILDNFVSYTPSSDQLAATFTSDQNSLASVCRVNGLLRELAEPILYRTYTKPTNLSTPHEGYQPNHNLRSFVLNLHNRVELRKHVRHIHLGEWETESSLLDSGVDIGLLHPINDKKWYRILVAALGCLSLRPRSNNNWRESICAGIEDAELALLLLYAPRLESLSIELPKMKYRPREVSYFESIIQTLAQDSGYHGFPRLERVIFLNSQHDVASRVSDPRASIRQGIQYAFLQVPTLTTYHAEGDQPLKNNLSVFPSAFRSLQPCSTAVKHIVLRHCDLPISDISQMIAGCKTLDTFELDMGCQEPHLRNDHLTWPQLLQALDPVKHTLRKLTLGTTRRCWLEAGVHAPSATSTLPWHPLGSLHHFTALTALVIDQTALLGLHTYDAFRRTEDASYIAPLLTRLLPPSLETLTVRHATCHTIRALSLLLSDLRMGVAHAGRMLHTVMLAPLSDRDLAALRIALGPNEAPVLSPKHVDGRLRGFVVLEGALLRCGVRVVVASLGEGDMRKLGGYAGCRVAAINQMCRL